MASVTLLSVCAGGNHLVLEVVTAAGARRYDVELGKLLAGRSIDEADSYVIENAKTAIRLAGATTYQAMRDMLAARTFQE